jgi:hypothetical protein
LTSFTQSAEMKIGRSDEYQSKYRVERLLPGASGHGYSKYPHNPVIRSAYLNCAIASAFFVPNFFRAVEPWSGQVKVLTKLEKLSKMGSDWGQ